MVLRLLGTQTHMGISVLQLTFDNISAFLIYSTDFASWLAKALKGTKRNQPLVDYSGKKKLCLLLLSNEDHCWMANLDPRGPMKQIFPIVVY